MCGQNYADIKFNAKLSIFFAEKVKERIKYILQNTKNIILHDLNHK